MWKGFCKDYELSWKYSEVYQNSKLPFTIAEDKYNEGDCSLERLEVNLVSLIGQKSVEMNMLGKLVGMTVRSLGVIIQPYLMIMEEKCKSIGLIL